MKKLLLSMVAALELGTVAGNAANYQYELATSFEAGSYVISTGNIIAVPLISSYTYGYPTALEVTITDGVLVTDEANEFVFTAVDGGYTMQDVNGRYYYQTGSYNSYNVSSDRRDDGSDIFSVTIDSEGYASILAVNVEKTMQYSTTYASYGSYSDVSFTLPNVYKKGAAVVEDENESNEDGDTSAITWVASEQGYTNGEVIESFTIANAVKVTCANGSNSSNGPKYYTTGTALRLYGGNTITFNCDDPITKIVFTTGSSNKFSESDANPDGFVIDGTTATWTGSATELTFTQGGTTGHVRIETIAVTIEGEGGFAGDDQEGDDDATGTSFTLVKEFAAGDYIISTGNVVATPLKETYTYGYLYTAEGTLDGDNLVTDEAYTFTFTAVDGGYTIQDCYGRYYYLSGSYNSFNVSTERVDGDTFTVSIDEDGYASIVNVAKEKTLQYDTTYSSYGSYSSVTYTLPCLYKKAETSAISSAVVDSNSVVRYVDMMGRTVANPVAGKVYIKVENGVATKIVK